MRRLVLILLNSLFFIFAFEDLMLRIKKSFESSFSFECPYRDKDYHMRFVGLIFVLNRYVQT
jgi:hypothetical protein